MLLDGLRCPLAREQLDVSRDDHRLNVSEALPVLVAPSEELPYGLRVSEAGVRVPDVDGEEFEETLGSFLSFKSDDAGKSDRATKPILSNGKSVFWHERVITIQCSLCR